MKKISLLIFFPEYSSVSSSNCYNFLFLVMHTHPQIKWHLCFLFENIVSVTHRPLAVFVSMESV